MKLLEISDSLMPNVAVVTDFDAGDTAMLIRGEEQAAASALKSDKRRREWIASRIAARHLAAKLAAIEPRELVIDSLARPPHARHGEDSFFVSFSHSGGAGAAALDRSRVGVDLEQIRPIDDRLRKFFLHDDESHAAAAIDVEHLLIHLWAAKEAAFKHVSSLALLKEIRFTTIAQRGEESIEARFAGGGMSGVVTTQRAGTFVLALAR